MMDYACLYIYAIHVLYKHKHGDIYRVADSQAQTKKKKKEKETNKKEK